MIFDQSNWDRLDLALRKNQNLRLIHMSSECNWSPSLQSQFSMTSEARAIPSYQYRREARKY